MLGMYAMIDTIYIKKATTRKSHEWARVEKGEDDPFVYRVQVLNVEVKIIGHLWIGKRYERWPVMCYPP